MKLQQKAVLSDDLKVFIQSGNYEPYILDLMNQSIIVFPSKYDRNKVQSEGQCDFFDTETLEKYEAKLPFDKKEGELICRKDSTLKEWIEFMMKEEEEFGKHIIEDRGKYTIESLQLYRTLEKRLNTVREDENAIILFPYPITFDMEPVQGCLNLFHMASDMNDSPCLHFLGFRNEAVAGWELYEKLIIEAVLQHYGSKTFSVDFVDNHWTALWFGLYQWNSKLNKYERRDNSERLGKSEYICYSSDYEKKNYPTEPKMETIVLGEKTIEILKEHAAQGTISLEELLRRNKNTKYKTEHKKWQQECRVIDDFNATIDAKENNAHMYLFLYLADTNASCIHGLYYGEDTYTIDLRKALPSTFLRPCSQHGWIVKGKDTKYDFNNNIVCVIRLSVDLVNNMLGNGTLLSQDNFFPNASIDQGYRVLLERQTNSGLDSNFPKVFPEGMIVDFEKKT